jgi:hypothetical protein
VNGDSKSANERGPFLGWFIGLAVPVQEIFCSVLAALVGPVQNIFFLTIHFFKTFVPIAQQAGQEAMLGSPLLVCVQSLYVSLIETEAKGDVPARLS